MTPKAARETAIHRWYLFPHSFTRELVHAFIDEWNLDKEDKILDPFAGAGTTLLGAKEKGVPSDGYDLSPLAVFVSNAKTSSLCRSRLEATWLALQREHIQRSTATDCLGYPELVKKALPDGRLEELDSIAKVIDALDCPSSERDFFLLALISIIPRMSHAVANGGWLRWLREGADAENVRVFFKEQVEKMLSDLTTEEMPSGDCNFTEHGQGNWTSHVADARLMPSTDATYSAVITSPPYPNRHDYTRIFGVELLFRFHDWDANRELRYQMFHSNPEARPNRPSNANYKPSKALNGCLSALSNKRMQHMLNGYFLDMYLCLCEVGRVCRRGARAAFVVGNAQYDGRPIFVDEFTAEIGEQAGLICTEIRAIRWRGNSAQQMGKYGRTPARESVVLFEKP